VTIKNQTIAFALALACLPLAAGCAGDFDQPDEAEDTQSQALTSKPAAPIGNLPDLDEVLDSIVIEPADPNLHVIASGDGWKKIHVTGQLDDPEAGGTREANEDIVVLTKPEAIQTAPLSALTKKRLAEEFAATGVAGTMARAADDDFVTVVSLDAAAQVDALEQAGVAFFGACSDYDSSYTRSLGVDKSFNFKKTDEAGSFTGAIDFSARFTGSATATARYRVHKSWCVPYKVSFKKVELVGNANLTATAKVDGKFQKQWKWEKTIAKPEIASFSFWAGPIPVYFKIRIPVEVAVDAKAQAELHAQAKVIGNGNFNVACSSSSCTGTKSATLTFAQDTPPSISVSAKVDVTPSVSAAIRGVLYSEDIAWGDVGVRGSLPASLWGYYGNGCGDADNDGVNEWVRALTLDLRAKVDVFARVDTAVTDKKEWTWNLANKHIGFWSFGDDSALRPIFYSSGVSGTTVTMHGRMRPCWPYTDKMTYRLTWGDGSVETVSASPTALFTKSHTFATKGSKNIQLQAVSDQANRDPNATTTRTVTILNRPIVDVPPIFGGGLVFAP